MIVRPSVLRMLGHRLRADTGGVAMLEFAFTAPIVLALGLYGVETANLALTNLKISQIALALADNASRVGDNSLSTQQLREVDMNDVLQAARYQGKSINLTRQGRITVSSLENIQRTYKDGTSDGGPVQRIHWQRCIGTKGQSGADAADYRSHYDGPTPIPITSGSDTTQTNRGVDASTGMGDPGAKVTAPANSGVMFVEINYNYKPLIGSYVPGISSATRIHYIASFIVRDPRDFSQLFNPTPSAARATCDLYAA